MALLEKKMALEQDLLDQGLTVAVYALLKTIYG
jgi:hypothetical protein